MLVYFGVNVNIFSYSKTQKELFTGVFELVFKIIIYSNLVQIKLYKLNTLLKLSESALLILILDFINFRVFVSSVVL